MGRFKSKAVNTLIAAMDEAKGEFVNSKRGADWVAILHTIAQVFPGDRVEIYTKYNEEHKPTPKGGGPRAKDATPGVKRSYGSTGGCKDCPGGGGNQNRKGLGPSVVPHVTTNTDHLLSEALVLEAFEGDVDLMLLHAGAQKINVGNSSKPETIARKIAFYHKQQRGIK